MEQEVTGGTFCECSGLNNEKCGTGLDTAACALTVLGGAGVDVTELYVNNSIAPLGCLNPDEFGPDQKFDADLDFVPDVSIGKPHQITWYIWAQLKLVHVPCVMEWWTYTLLYEAMEGEVINHTLTWQVETEWRIFASINLTLIGSDNGLSPGRRQAIIWANATVLLIGPLGKKL